MNRSDAGAGFQLGLIQTRCTPDPEDNLRRTLNAVAEAARSGAQVVCTQELFRSPYFCQTEDPLHFELAEPIPGPTTDALCRLAREHRVVIVASLFEKRAPGLHHNTAVVIDADGTLLGRYRKMHIPDDPGYYEKFYFAPGDLGFRVWRTRYATLGVLVCWDQWFPEAARLTALQGAEILLYPTAIGWLPAEKAERGQAQHDAWETIQRSHAIANGCYVAAANRVGFERSDADRGIEFWGQSFVADPFGQIVARAEAVAEATLIVPIHRDRIAAIRNEWPFLRDRRIEHYAAIGRQWIEPSTAPVPASPGGFASAAAADAGCAARSA